MRESGRDLRTFTEHLTPVGSASFLRLRVEQPLKARGCGRFPKDPSDCSSLQPSEAEGCPTGGDGASLLGGEPLSPMQKKKISRATQRRYVTRVHRQQTDISYF